VIAWDRALPYQRRASQTMRRAMMFLSYNRSALADRAVQDALVNLTAMCASAEVRTIRPSSLGIRRARSADYEAALMQWVDAIAAWRERTWLARHEPAASPALRQRLLLAIAEQHSGDAAEGARIAAAVLEALLNPPPMEGT